MQIEFSLPRATFIVVTSCFAGLGIRSAVCILTQKILNSVNPPPRSNLNVNCSSILGAVVGSSIATFVVAHKFFGVPYESRLMQLTAMTTVMMLIPKWQEQISDKF